MDHICKDTGYNTPAEEFNEKIVTVTHPHHPLFGQTGRIVRTRWGHVSRLTIELTDGTQARIDPNDTDFAVSTTENNVTTTKPLLCVDGLLSIVKLINRNKLKD